MSRSLLGRKFPYLLLVLVIFGLVVFRYDSFPPLWFDEGWSLSLARNWVELGHYGHLKSGEPVPATVLNTGFPAVGALAISFRLFGVGAWQARLPGLFFTLGGLGALYYLASRIYDPSIGVAALLVSLFLPMHGDLHPIFIGRQAIGEMPAVFYLLVGYALLTLVWDKAPCFMTVPALFWALSLRTKPQVLPFVVFSMIAVLGISIRLKSHSAARKILLGMILTAFIERALALLWAGYVRNHTLSQNTSTDPYAVLGSTYALLTYVIVPILSVRLRVLRMLLLLPIVGMVWNGIVLLKEVRKFRLSTKEHVIRLMLWSLTVSWYAWYLLLSIGWPRYLFPAAFVGSIHLAVCLRDMTDGFRMKRTLDKAALLFGRGGDKIASLGTTFMIVLVVVAFRHTLEIYRMWNRTDNHSLEQVAHFLDAQMDQGDLVETYESELFFLLHRPYHYPPDRVQHELNRRTLLGESIDISYDPLMSNPDYIVTGPINGVWGLYDDVLAHNSFDLCYQHGPYRVYQRGPGLDLAPLSQEHQPPGG